MDNINAETGEINDIDEARANDAGEGEATVVRTTTRIPPGVYEAEYVRHVTRPPYKGKGKPKLYVYFKIVTPGPGEGSELPRYYNVDSLDAKGPRESGGFSVTDRQDYYKDFCRIVGDPKRHNRISPAAMRGKRVSVRVADVVADDAGELLIGGSAYSKITAVIGCADVLAEAPPPSEATTSSEADTVTSPLFQEFWDAWPDSVRKTRRGDCWKLWRDRSYDAVAADIMDHVSAMLDSSEWNSTDGDFVVAPYKYLNERHWEGWRD